MAPELHTSHGTMKTNQNVRLRTPHGGLVMSIHTDYDWQMVFEHITNRARHESWVDVTLGSHHWRAFHPQPGVDDHCSACGVHLTIVHDTGTNHLCTRCCHATMH